MKPTASTARSFSRLVASSSGSASSGRAALAPPRPATALTAIVSRPLSTRTAYQLAAGSVNGTSAAEGSRRTFFSLPDISKLAGLGETETKDEQSRVEIDGEEHRFHARKILPYSPSQLYNLVSDVPSYSSFIPYCTASRLLPSSLPPSPGQWRPASQPFDIEAELAVGFGGFSETYISRVVGRPFDSVTATAVEGTPQFKSLKTTWSFSPASGLSPHGSAQGVVRTRQGQAQGQGDGVRRPNETGPRADDPDQGPTLLTIDLGVVFANPLYRIASQAVLPKVADKMVEAFEKRCLEVWGQGRA